MSAWVELAHAVTPGGDQLRLRRCDDAYEIRCNGWEVMSSRGVLSESALARHACAALPARAAVLIGGLGMGFSLRAALDVVPADARVTVAELVPEIVAWNRFPLADLARRPLDDPRVAIRIADVRDLLEPAAFDAILLDVDNGPDAVLYAGNSLLYTAEGIARAARALRPGGTLAIWSADRSPGFETALDAAGLRWRRVAIDARGDGRGPEHSLYFAHAA